MPLDRGYVLCGDARSGSTFLAHALASTGVLGRPGELFRDPAWVRSIASDGRLFLDAMEQVTTPNGVYGLKVFTSHFDLTRNLAWPQLLPNLHFAYLERRDLLGQAISLTRALQSSQFQANHPKRRTPRYDRRAISDCLARLAYGRARWECYFARNQIDPLRLVYEDVIDDVQAAAEAVAAAIGLQARPIVDLGRIVPPPQRSGESDLWRKRFVGEMADPDYLDGGMLLGGRRGSGRLARLFLGP